MSALLASVGWPVLDRFRLGSLAISPHGLGIAVGFMLGASLLTKIAPARLVPDDGTLTSEELLERRTKVRADYEKMLFWALIGTIIGARLFYVIAHLSEYSGIADMLAIWNGGISLLGGIAGAIIINLPRMRKLGYRFLQVMDPTVICLAMGIGIGRVGDLIIGDHLGKPASWALSWTYHGGTLPGPWVSDGVGGWTAQLAGGYLETFSRAGATLCKAPAFALTCTGQKVIAHGVGVHQTALYDMLLAWPLFALLWWMAKEPRRRGVLTLTFGVWYGLQRLLEDSIRIDKRFGPFTGSQWTALTVATICALMLLAWAVTKESASPTIDDADSTSASTPR